MVVQSMAGNFGRVGTNCFAVDHSDSFSGTLAACTLQAEHIRIQT
jgi:hypothetical protein